MRTGLDGDTSLPLITSAAPGLSALGRRHSYWHLSYYRYLEPFDQSASARRCNHSACPSRPDLCARRSEPALQSIQMPQFVRYWARFFLILTTICRVRIVIPLFGGAKKRKSARRLQQCPITFKSRGLRDEYYIAAAINFSSGLVGHVGHRRQPNGCSKPGTHSYHNWPAVPCDNRSPLARRNGPIVTCHNGSTFCFSNRSACCAGCSIAE
jgi:hypothetical protein